MSPPVLGKKESATARLLGSGTSGIAELLVFHPVDTVAKRLMSNKDRAASMSAVLFKEKAQAPIVTRFLSLFPGLGYAAGYKVLQRVYKFGGQPYFNDYLTKHHKRQFEQLFGERTGKSVMSATAGSYVARLTTGSRVSVRWSCCRSMCSRSSAKRTLTHSARVALFASSSTKSSTCTVAGAGRPRVTRRVRLRCSAVARSRRNTCSV